MWAVITKVWKPCAHLLPHTVGSDYQGVEPLCPFTTAHWAVITKVWNPCAHLLLHAGNDH